MIAVTAIIKNEEVMLPEMLKSCGDLPVYIIDTGSSDGCYDIYKEFGVTWKKSVDWDDCKGVSEKFHFSNARNEVRAFAHEHEWHIILDADEILTGDFVRQIKKIVKSKWIAPYNAVAVTVQTDVEELTFPRVLRNIPDIYWEDPVHNVIPYMENNRDKVYADYGLRIRSKYSPAHLDDPDRTVRMLERAIKDYPNKIRFLYYLSREYLPRDKVAEAILLLEKYVRGARPNNELADAYHLLALAYLDSKRPSFDPMKAWENAWECIKMIPTTKGAWEILHHFSNPAFKDFIKKIVDIADNSNVLTVRKDGKVEGQK